VKEDDDYPVGAFLLPSNQFQLQACSVEDGPQSTITNSLNDVKTISDFYWLAPTSCDDAEFTIR